MRVRHTIIDTLFKMNEELRYKKIGNICDVKTGKLDANASDENGAYPFFTCSKEPLRINTYSYDAECVLIAGNGELNVKYYNGKFDAYQRTYILTTKNGVSDVSTQYLYLFFQLYVETLRKNSIGGVIKYIKLGDITEANIPVPPLSTQSRIVSELDLLQSIIDKQKAQLKELDNLAQAIFYDMFGDPVENEKGWEVKKFGDECSEMKYGTSRPSCENGKYPYLRMCNISNDGHLDLNNLKTIDVPNDEVEKCIVRYGDILFNRTNSIELIGKTCMFDSETPMIIAGYIIRVRLSEKLESRFISCLFNMPSIKKKLRAMAKGAVNQANINSRELASVIIPIPPLSLQQSFAQKVESIERQKELINQSIREAQTLFDSRMEYYFGE